MNDDNDDWISDELTTGLQKLLCLRLDRTPAADMILGTVSAWHEAITDGSRFDSEVDAPRFRSAFRTLAKTRDTWPAPKDFLAALPDRPEPPKLKRIESQSRQAAAQKALAEIAEMLRITL